MVAAVACTAADAQDAPQRPLWATLDAAEAFGWTAGAGDHYGWVHQIPVLTAATERRLALAMQRGDEAARERLWRANLRWGLSIARWHTTKRATFDDLVQVAWLTLWIVLPDFDPSMGFRITTFVTSAILRDVRRAVSDLSSLIRRPVHVVDDERREFRFIEEYYLEHGEEPSIELVATALDMPQDVLRARREETHATRQPVVSLDREILGHSTGMAEHVTLADMLAADEDATDLHRAAEQRERAATVARFVAATLNLREQQIIALHYGDDPRFADNMAAIARVLRPPISRERVRQIHDGALAKLRLADRGQHTLSRLLS